MLCQVMDQALRRSQAKSILPTALFQQYVGWGGEMENSPCTYNNVSGSTSITSAVALHLLSRANDCARRNNSLSAVRLAA